MIVLSLFDGMSCGRLALERAGIHEYTYFASEIDPHAMRFGDVHYSDMNRLGDIRDWESWKIPQPDLIIGGSPCTSFSIAGNMTGFNGASGLYRYYRDILNRYTPTYFLLENVVMKDVWANEITKDLGVNPAKINSSLVSAQSRRRMYWSNLPITQPADKKIYVRDILEKDYSKVDPKLLIDKTVLGIDTTELVNMFKQVSFDKPHRLLTIGKSRQGYRVYDMDGKSITLSAEGGGLGRQTGLYLDQHNNIRRLTINECEKLQTLPSGYCNILGVTDRQKYRAMGNGWTVDVIAHILKGIKW